jgi:hypothetical protein
MFKPITWFIITLSVVMAGCAEKAAEPRPVREHADQAVMYVQTNGSYHKPDKPITGGIWVKGSKGAKQPGAQDALLVVRGALLERGFQVVERENLPLLLEEQETQLKYGDDRQTDQLSVGKILGAQLVAFVETESKAVDDYWEGFHVSVSVRVVGVETGAVHFLGTAKWSRPAPTATYGIEKLAMRAVSRAFCPPEQWQEASAGNGWTNACRE